MATYIPNEMNNALYELNRMLVQMAMQKRSLDQDESQFGRRLAQGDSQFSQTHEAQLARDAVSKRANTWTEMMALSQLLTPGQSISNSPLIQPHLRELFPGFDPSNAEDPLGGWTPNPETLKSYMEKGTLDYAKALEGTPEGKQWMQRATNQQVLGTNQTTSELDFRTQQARVLSEGINAAMSNRNIMVDAGRVALGLEPIRRITLPDGSVRQWNSTAEMSISVDIWKFTQALESQNASTVAAARGDLHKSLIEQSKAAGIILGPGTALRIIDAYYKDAKDPSKAEEIAKLRESYRLTKNIEGLAALEFFTSGFMTGQSFIQHLLKSTPAGREYLTPIMTMQGMEAIVGKESAAQFTSDLLERMRGSGLNVPGIYLNFFDRYYNSRGNRFGAPSAPQVPQSAVQSLNTSVPQSTGQNTHAPTLNPRTEEEAVALMSSMRADAQALANGSLTPAQLRAKYQDNAFVTAIMQTSRTLQSTTGGR
jgi:hypothetical protein